MLFKGAQRNEIADYLKKWEAKSLSIPLSSKAPKSALLSNLKPWKPWKNRKKWHNTKNTKNKTIFSHHQSQTEDSYNSNKGTYNYVNRTWKTKSTLPQIQDNRRSNLHLWGGN